MRHNALGLVAIFIALTGTAVAGGDGPRSSTGGGPEASAGVVNKKKFKKLKRRVAALERRGATGPAGGALAGAYPNPTLNVSGGPCPNGQELVYVSPLAALTCSAGVYSDGDANVAAGPTSFPALTTGSHNSALGVGALGSNTTGHSNSAVGREASEFNAIGTNNTAVGRQALRNNSGTGNTAVGSGAGVNLTTGSNNVDIASSGIAGESNTIRIGSGFQTRTFIAGIHGVTTGGAAIPVVIDSNGQLGTTSSSRRLKRDIRPLGALRPLMKLRPVSFRYRSGPPELHYGLLAEQVARALPELAVSGSDGLPETVQYQELPVLLLAEIQNQQRQINRQQAQIDRLMREVGDR